MTKEQFKEYICQQIDLMSSEEIEEFSKSLSKQSSDEHIAQELIVIKGEFKKLTKLVYLMEQKLEQRDEVLEIDKLQPFIRFDALLQNVKDAINSIPKASMFNSKKINRVSRSLKKGFNSVIEQYTSLLEDIEIKRGAKIGDKFDANLHEAVEVVNSKKIEDGIVVEILEDGFIYRDKIINYAKVKVNRWT